MTGVQTCALPILRHSFNGLYDFIISDLFSLTEKNGQFRVEIFSDESNRQVAEFFDKELQKNGYQLDEIKFIEALSPAIWEEQLDVSDATALGAVLRQAGFDPDVLAAKAQDPAVKQLVIDNTAQAVARGCFGIPTFFVGKEMFFGKERLGQIEELLERE